MSTAHTGKSARHGQSWLRRGAGMLVIPALCWAVMALACALAGTSLLTGVSSLRLFVRGLTYVLLLSFGVSINMHTGRFDFSTGAVMLLGGVCGALIAYGNGWGPWGMLLISIPTGAAAGCVSGLLYILLRLPPMIIGLGMTLVLEGIVAIITDGCRPVGFGTDASYYRFSVNMPAMLALSGVALILMVLLFHYTRFGYDYRALQTGQRTQTHIHNSLSLYIRQIKLFDQFCLGSLHICRASDNTNDFINMILGDEQAFQNMGPFLGFSQVIFCPANDQLFLEGQIFVQNMAQGENTRLRLVIHQREHDNGKA